MDYFIQKTEKTEQKLTTRFVDDRRDVTQKVDWYYYDEGGKHLEEEKKAVARKGVSDQKTIYEIKVGQFDAEMGRPYNPNPAFKMNVHFDKSRSAPVYVFQKVSQTAFNNYLKFLETGKSKFYGLVEKEIGDA